jgi:hypothetical protein
MKKNITILLIMAGLASAYTEIPPAKVDVRVVVVDQDGKPVSDANCIVSFDAPPQPPQTEGVLNIPGTTDQNGVFTVSAQTRASVSCEVTKAGYYKTIEVHRFDINKMYEAFVAGKPLLEWQSEPLEMKVTLKPIINPIPMYARRVNSAIPEFGKPLGFDLSVGDWVAPHGEGTITDMIFTAVLDRRAEQDFDYTLTITFPNEEDGIQTFEAPYKYGSALKSPHQAPEGGYQSRWVQSRSRTPNQPEQTNYDLERNYFFRVRTVLDEKGNVKSANYGKIYGDFMNFVSYFNPTPNDRNVEFDVQRNLFPGLKSFQVIRNP